MRRLRRPLGSATTVALDANGHLFLLRPCIRARVGGAVDRARPDARAARRAALRAGDSPGRRAAGCARPAGGHAARREEERGATYPKQALDDGVRDTVEVPVLLDIDATGLVTRAVVEKPVGHGFDEAAVAAGRSWSSTGDPRRQAGRGADSLHVHVRAAAVGALRARRDARRGAAGWWARRSSCATPRGRCARSRPDADGAWRVDGLTAGSYHVTIQRGRARAARGRRDGAARRGGDRRRPARARGAGGPAAPAAPEERRRRGRSARREAAAVVDEADARSARDQPHPRDQR